MAGAFHPIAFDEFTFDVDYSTSTALYASIAGEARAAGRSSTDSILVVDSLKISTIADDAPNRATFNTMGFIPSVGARVVMALGGIDNPDRRFAGNILTVDQGYVGDNPENQQYQVACIDDTWRLNKRKIIGHFTGSATDIVLSLMATFAPGFTTTNVVASLPTVDGGITFTNQDLTECLTQIAKRIGAYWYLDYLGDLHFFLTEAGEQPDPLDADHPSMRDIRVSRDISQVVTRVFVEGGGGTCLSEVPIGESILPVSEPSWYNEDGGVVVAGPQRIRYTGVDQGGAGSLVGPGTGPTAAMVAALANGAGVTTGAHSWAYTFVTAAGESLPSPLVALTVGVVDPPTGGPTAATTTGFGPDPGAHYYAITNVTAVGETTPSPVSNTVTTTAGVTDPASAPTAAVAPTTGFGNLDVGKSYTYKYTYADSAGRETLPSAASSPAVVVDTAQRIRVTIPYSTDVRVARIYLYRSANGGGGPWTRTDIALAGANDQHAYVNNSTAGGSFSIDDIEWTAEGTGTAAPSQNATGTRVVNLTGLQLPTSSLVTSRKLYGTAAGGSQLKLIATLNLTDTTYSVTIADASLGANVPVSNTATANQVNLSSIGIGPSGTTDRKIYRTVAGGAQLKLVTTLAGNVATTYTDSTADGSLGANAPSSDTSGLTQAGGQVLAGSTSIIVASTSEFPTAGWALLSSGLIIRYTGKTSQSLTGIPATGVGSLMATVSYNTTITAAPQLTGITSGSPSNGSITYTIPKGQDVSLLVEVNDTGAQELIGAILLDDDGNETDGILEGYLQDRRLSEAEAIARGQAYLDLHSEIETTIYYQCQDLKTKVGRDIDVDIADPMPINGTFKIQTVDESFMTQPDGQTLVFFDVMASTTRFSFEDLLRQVRGR
jgi:hypothetical protein